MKGSKELIEHYNKRKEELGEKATKLNMYLEGYAEGYRDRKKPTQSWIEKAKYELEHEEELSIERAYELGKIRGRKELIDKACEWMKGNLGYYNRNEVHIGKSYEQCIIEDFLKAMEK